MDLLRPFKLIAISLAFSLLAGCTAPDSPVTLPPPAPGLSGSNLKPYATATHAVIPTVTVSATDIPLPTPTPSVYTVTSGDTLGAIAERFGLRLADLQAANPGVLAESLSVGQKLNIPAVSPDHPLPSPAPAQVGAVTCYPSGGGAYCLAPVYNPFPETLENVKLQMTLLDPKGRPLPYGHDVASLEAFLPLDILPPSSALPAYAFFPAIEADSPPTGTSHPSAQLAASIRLAPDDRRYLPAIARSVLVSVSWDGHSARVQGQVFLPATSQTAAKTIWLAAVAYDVDGQMVGFRRWEWQGSLKPGKSQPFDLSVYSLGPAIESVDVIVEARP